MEEALAGLPEEFASALDNIVITVQDLPTPQQLEKIDVSNPHHLLGLYEGIDLTRRPLAYAGALPDRITIFQASIEEMCSGDDEVRMLVRQTVMHELGHYFGMSEEQLHRIEEEE